MKSTKKSTVLFLCTGNSARSQMAEALLRHKAGDKYTIFSAGTHPEAVDSRAIQALSKFGLSTESLVSKDVSTFENQVFDYVITLCDKANAECRSYPNAGKQLAWDFPDPKSRAGDSPFTVTLNELSNRLSMFLLVEGKDANSIKETSKKVNANTTAETNEQTTCIDPIIFYKSLSDEIRLKTLLLAHYHGELCVCELMNGLDENSQPKVSRNLAVLKKAQIITDRKHGQWVFYRINPTLPLWAKAVIAQTAENNIALIEPELHRLNDMTNRPDKANFCK